MIAQSWFDRCWPWQIGGCVAIFGTLCAMGGEIVNAQIVPDNTLGAESSVVTPNVNIRGIQGDRIDGGATRGANLFHSFGNFNVGEGRGAYFANPTGIENILTRVTGGNPSNILGRLGVLGGANLFLLNPNGIVFGPNASLDIQGSFVATTADRIQLGDTGYFSAARSQTSSLLSVSPGALFFNAVADLPTSIINQGNLATPKNLTLSAGNLDLQGELKAGGDLTLQAQDTVKVRDSVTTPFLANSGGNLTIIGNRGIDILALNHPTQTPFVSGGNLSLIGDGVISLDARFSSGGSFSIQSLSGELANFVSLYDPIISSNGDVDVAANYTGASLLVESKGNIRILGDINITGPDTNTLPVGPDTATLSTSSALILRSGQSALAYGGVNAGVVPNASNGLVPAGITLGGNVTLQPFNGAGGIVKLLAASGNVSTRGMTTNGGAIDVNSAGSITTNGQTLSTKNGDDFEAYINSFDPNSYSYTYTGSGLPAPGGGAISLLAANGNITTGNLDSYSFSVLNAASGGGDIRLIASNGSINTGNLRSYSFSRSAGAGQGGAISLTAANDINITGDLYSYSVSDSFSDSGDAGQGGAISLTAANDINIT
ncbi:filamentous hemagglutinin N-terminal domain-containing protein, partial [Microcoleus sp. herbarium14]|uniref:two-partner secretion domain-containing protein n=1 Tax=Microcoleus sp. herbarium14 TaxID=3055439 RepID=UPI002FD32645